MNNNKILNTSKNFFEEDEFAFEIKEPQNPLLVGWKWIEYNDGSGHLESPSGKSYFCYDWATTEYRETRKSPLSTSSNIHIPKYNINKSTSLFERGKCQQDLGEREKYVFHSNIENPQI